MLRQHPFHASGPTRPPPKVASYHEFYRDDASPRDHYAPVWEQFRRTEQNTLDAKSREACRALTPENAFRRRHSRRGVGTDPGILFDILPRILTASEWRSVETGLAQRIRALNLFLRDIYGRQDILKDGVVPSDLIYNAPDFRCEVMDISPPRGVYTHIGSADLIRDQEGRFMVLKDNLRAPSGVSCMIENRMVERRVLPELFSHYRVRGVEQYPAVLSKALRRSSPRGEDRATIVMLMAGQGDAGYFEHAFLAREMGVELAMGQDLVCRNETVYLKTRWGLRQVDVVYRRVSDDFLDPLVFNRQSAHGVAGIIDAWRAGNVAIVNAPGVGIADSKAVHARVPDIIRYYLGEAPVLPNVPTFEMTDSQDQEYVLDNLERMVVKAVVGPGGGGVIMGPSSTPAQRSGLARKIRDNPRNYVAQPVMYPSRHVCYLYGELESRRLDLRSFAIHGHDVRVIPGGLTRVDGNGDSPARAGPRGNGSKDTWVLAD